MKKSVVTRVAGTIAAVAVIFMASACSDGEHGAGPELPVPMVSPISITKFQISKVGGGAEPGSSVTIEAGDSVLLEWEVMLPGAGGEEGAEGEVAPKGAKAAPEAAPAEGGEMVAAAPEITLDSEALGLHLEGLDPAGSHQVDNVTADAVFVLTAKDGETADIREVTATIATGAGVEVTFTATPAEIFAGETSELCWTISDAEAAYTVIDASGNTIASSEARSQGGELAEGDELVASGEASYIEEDGEEGGEGEEEAEETEAPPQPAGISECATVTPTETTAYYLTVVASGSDEIRKEATVTVKENVVIESFTASPEAITGETEVTLSWTVTPENAVVSISGIEGEFAAAGSTTVIISDTTTFDLTATLPGCDTCTATTSVTVELARVGGDAYSLSVSGGKVIFGGESATISWTILDINGAPAAGGSVLITGGEFGDAGQVFEGSGEITVAPEATTEYNISLISADGAAVAAAQPVKIAVRAWSGPGADTISIDAATAATRPVTAVAVAGPDIIYAGFGSDFAGGTLSLAKGIGAGPHWEAIKFPFMSVFPALHAGGANNPAYFDDFEYPINSIVVDQATGRVYIATTGGVFYSNDEGASWNVVVGVVLGSDVQVPRPTCKGGEMSGWSGFEINGLSQVCDVAISEGGRFIYASDIMIEYLPDGVGEAAPMSEAWQGHENVAYGRVSHDLEIAKIGGGEVLFVGTSAGILSSLDLGGSYNSVVSAGAPEGDVYAVKADSANGKLYAGGADGKVYTCALSGVDCQNWSSQALSGSPIYSFELDPVKSGGIFAATGNGVYYSSNGSSWQDVTHGAMESGVVVKGLVGTVSPTGDRGSIYVGTSKGVFVSTSDVISGACTDCAVMEDQPIEEPFDEEGEEEEASATGVNSMLAL